jgi:hypothetical protein
MQQWYGTVGLHTRPALAWLSELTPYLEGSYITNLSSRLDTRVVTAALDVFFRPDGGLQLEVSDEFDRLTEPFTVAAGHTIPAGGYGFRRAGIQYVAGTGRALSGNVGVSTGGFYHGDRTTWNAALTWRASYRLRVEGLCEQEQVPQKEAPAMHMNDQWQVWDAPAKCGGAPEHGCEVSCRKTPQGDEKQGNGSSQVKALPCRGAVRARHCQCLRHDRNFRILPRVALVSRRPLWSGNGQERSKTANVGNGYCGIL